MLRRFILAAVILAIVTRCSLAELKPADVGIIAMQRSDSSRALAAYYAKARGIPESRICLIDAPAGVTLPRDQWNKSVRPGIRRWLRERQLTEQVRCLVTVWDVPLKIGRDNTQSAAKAERQDHLETERRIRLEQLLSMIDDTNRLLPAGGALNPARLPGTATAKQLATGLEKAFRTAQQRLAALENQSEAQRVAGQLRTTFIQSGGTLTLVRSLGRQQALGGDAQATQQGQIELLKGRLIGLREALAALQMLPETISRDQQILSILEKSDGSLGALAWIEAQLELLRKNETYASFDSELSLLLWPDYPLLRWQPNTLYHKFDTSGAPAAQRTLMVSRLEAPTLQLTKRLIDTALAVEKKGLQGTVYLDARGIEKKSELAARGSYSDYDQSLIGLAATLEKHTRLKVVLDRKQPLFQPGQCPDAALYCGWYSLAKYVDAFDWVPGSVAYHLASSEATTLRDPQSNVWCKRLLEDGVCATVGPVYEPYLAAFPRPDEFVPLLLCGRYTLAECYYHTNPFNSWVMVLVGDPLYNPFRSNPQFTHASMPDSLKRLIHEPAADDTILERNF